MYNPEFPIPQQESHPPLPQELISLCKQGIADVKSAQNNFDEILDTLDRNGVNDEVRPAYMEIMLAEQELSKHKKALEGYIS
jgi:hypothetical protein